MGVVFQSRVPIWKGWQLQVVGYGFVCPGGSSVVRVVGSSQFGFDFTMPLTAILDDLMCTGDESNLFDCPHPGATVENCATPFSDANLICGTSGKVFNVGFGFSPPPPQLFRQLPHGSI